ncbi:MAG: hypothetical protein U0R80_06270 [Nocardioidaceae bacterium]
MRTTSRVKVAMAAAALPVTLLTAGCSGGDDGGPDATSSTSAPPPLETTVSVGKVAGRLPDPAATQVAAEVAAVADGWIDAAFVGGDYPRETFADAFPGFTRGAAADAAEDVRLMSNADIGGRIDAVAAVKRQVRVDVLGVKGKAQGATAHVRLVFRTSGDLERRVTVTGRLLLTQAEDGTWQIFAYDVSKGGK